MKLVSTKSFFKSNPMKISLPRFLALMSIVCTPLMLLGKKTNEAGKKSVVVSKSATNDSSEYINAPASLYEKMNLSLKGISLQAFTLALKGFGKLAGDGMLNKDSILTIIDFTRSSREKRLVVIDLKTNEVVCNSVVAHGRNTGAEYAKSFSNQPRSNKSSLGFYITQETYFGAHGLSLKLDGFERGINDKARERAIVMHGADYASEPTVSRKGFLGRSFGCPAVPPKLTKTIIQKIKNGNCLFVYYPDKRYLQKSTLLNG
jgi:hypothetical protein